MKNKKNIILILLGILMCLVIVLRISYSIEKSAAEEFLSTNIKQLNEVLVNKSDIHNQYAFNNILDSNGHVPAYSYYTHTASRAIKELRAYDNKIFMGIGDWNDNTGPAKIIYYDTKTGEIVSSGTIADEAVEEFYIIDGKLYTTGTDPRNGWGYGSYYVYNDSTNSWEQHEFNNGWVHAFEITKFHDKMFMCGSVSNAQKTPIQVSYDDGKSFQNVNILFNGEPLPYSSSLRFYAFEQYRDTLYAYTYSSVSDYTLNGLYKYDEETNTFNFIRKLGYEQSQYGVYESYRYNYLHFKNNTVFADHWVYVSGNYLYKTQDMINYTKIVRDTTDVTQDVVVHDDILYTLSYQYNTDKTFTIRIYSTKDLEKYNLVYEFDTDTLPFSIEYHDNNLYIGTTYNSYSKDYEEFTTGVKAISDAGSLYRIDLDYLEKSLVLDSDNEEIDITANGITYPVKYDLSSGDSDFEVKLTFDKNMSKLEWEQEYTKFSNLELLYALANNKERVDYDNSINYFNNIMKDKVTIPENFTTSIEYADAIFSKGISVTDERFIISTKEINKTSDSYEVVVSLKVENVDDKVTSEKYIVSEADGYIYVAQDYDEEIIKSNLQASKYNTIDVDLDLNKIYIKFNDAILKEYNLIYFNTTRKMYDNYIYVSNLSEEEIVDSVNVTHASAVVNQGKLEITYNNQVVVAFNLLSINFGTFTVASKILAIKEIVSYNEIVDNIVISENLTYKIFNGTSEITSGNVKTGTIKVYYNEEEIDVFDIIAGYLEFDSSLKVDESNLYIKNLAAGIIREEIVKKVYTSGMVSILDVNDNEINETQPIGTGNKVVVKLGEKTYTYTLVITGDVTADGIVNIADVIKLADYIKDETIFTFDYEKAAADVNCDGVINQTDLTKLADYTIDKSLGLGR